MPSGRPRQERCKRGHLLSEAHSIYDTLGLKRTCRKCRAIRHKTYNERKKGKKS